VRHCHDVVAVQQARLGLGLVLKYVQTGPASVEEFITLRMLGLGPAAAKAYPELACMLSVGSCPDGP